MDRRGRFGPRGRGTGDSAVQHLDEAPRSTPQETRTDTVTPGTGDFALSPDGSKIAFVAPSGGVSRLWLRSLSDATAHLLPGTEGAEGLFWSPDSRSIAFFARLALRRLDLGESSTSHRDGRAARLRDVGRGRRHSHSGQNITHALDVLRRVSTAGGGEQGLRR